MENETDLSRRIGKVYLKIPGETFYLDLVRKMISDIAGKVGFSPDDIFKIEMAVDEACTNVMKYAYIPKKDIRLHKICHLKRATDIKRSIDLWVHVDSEKISVIIHDQGCRFDFNKYGKIDLDKYLAQMQIGGLGIYVIRNFMDDVQYKHIPGIGNELKMIKYFQK